MIKKWILVIAGGLVLSTAAVSDDEHIPYTCQKKCFDECKLKNQAVKNCKFSNLTTVSFRVTCECRDLQEGEALPAYFHNTRLIKTTAF